MDMKKNLTIVLSKIVPVRTLVSKSGRVGEES
jgi:hypothetical protein